MNKDKEDKAATAEQPSVVSAFTVHWGLYIILSAIFILVSVITFFIPQSCTLSSILSGIGSGGFASVVVACLVEYANCAQNKRTAEHHRDVLFRNFSLVFDSGIQHMIYFCLSLEEVAESDRTRTWIEWITLAYQLALKDDETLERFCRICHVFLSDVGKRAHQVYAQSALLLNAGIVADEDVYAIFTIDGICEKANYDRGEDRNTAERLLKNAQLLNMTLLYTSALKHISEAKISPFLFDKVQEYFKNSSSGQS